MSNFSNEVLRITIDKLKNKAENTMFKINILLENDKNISAVDDLEKLLYDLDRYHGAISQAKNIQSQLDANDNLQELIKQRADMLMNLSKKKNDEDINLTE